MSKAVYQEVSENIIDNFKVGARLSALTSNKKNGEIYSFDHGEFNRIAELLSPNQKFKKSSTKRKAFVLPDVKYTVARIREYAKNVNLSIVNDLNEADVIISHNDVKKEFSYHDTISPKSLAFHYQGVVYINSEETETALCKFDHPKAINISYQLNRWQSWRAKSSSDQFYLCTPLALMIAYQVEQHNVPVYNIEDIVKEQEGIDIDKDLIDMLYSQCNSTDDDFKMAQKIIPTIDVSKKPYLIWHLVQKLTPYYYKLSKSKDVQAWMSKHDWDSLSGYNAEQFCKYLINKDEMTKEAFAELEPIMRREIVIYNRDFYKFQVSIKDEYKKYL